MKNTILLTLLAVLVVVSACHKDQPEMNTFNQGCETIQEVTAEFTMEEGAGLAQSLIDKRTETDTIFGGKPVWFSAQEDSAEYTWYIGAEVVTEQEFYRTFDNSLVGQTLPMHLVVKKKANLICNPADDGYDSITKYLTIVDGSQLYTLPNRHEGVYRLCDSASVDSIDVTIDFDEDYQPIGGGPKILFYNIGLWNGGYEIACTNAGINYKQLWCGGAGCFVNGVFTFPDVNHIDLVIKGTTSWSQCKASYHFKGRKIN